MNTLFYVGICGWALSTLNAAHAAALQRVLARTGESQAALVRRLIREAERAIALQQELQRDQ